MVKFILFSIPLLYEGFESGAIPSSWRIGNGGDPNYTWRIAQYGEYFPFEPPQEGNYYVVCDTIYSLYEDTLISPSFSIPANIQGLKLYYNLSFLKDTVSLSRGDILVRVFSGGSWGVWNVVKTYGGDVNPSFINGTDSVNLQSYVSSESLKVAFSYYKPSSDTGFFMLDAVHIEAKLQGDVGATKIISPLEYFEANTPTPVIVEYENYSNAIQSFYIKCEIRDSITEMRVYRDSAYVSINPLSKDTVELADFTGNIETSYHILAWTSLLGDPDPSNDTIESYSTTHPFFGAIIKEIPLPRSDSGFQDLTFRTVDNLIYIVHSSDTVFAIDENGTVNLKYPLNDFSQGNNVDVPFGIFFDRESNSFFTTQVGVPQGGGSFQWCYVVHYSNTFNLIDSFNLKQRAGIVTLALADAGGSNLGFAHKAIFPSSYRVYKLDFLNETQPKVDSFTFSNPLYFLAGALASIGDTIFISSGMGLSTANMVSGSGLILGERTFEDEIRGIAMERREVSEYIYAYVNIGGYKIYKISTGLKWSVNKKEDSYKRGKEVNIVPTVVRGIEKLREYSGNPLIFDISGRKINITEISKTGRIIYLKTDGKTYKIILLR